MVEALIFYGIRISNQYSENMLRMNAKMSKTLSNLMTVMRPSCTHAPVLSASLTVRKRAYVVSCRPQACRPGGRKVNRAVSDWYKTVIDILCGYPPWKTRFHLQWHLQENWKTWHTQLCVRGKRGNDEFGSCEWV